MTSPITTRPRHELAALWRAMDTNEKALLRELYKESDPRPLAERRIDPQWVRRFNFWTQGPALRRHIEALVARGFLVQDEGAQYSWRPSTDPEVQKLVLGKTEATE